ncbi:MAG: hypothetical protein ABJA87_13370 [bacterium]
MSNPSSLYPSLADWSVPASRSDETGLWTVGAVLIFSGMGTSVQGSRDYGAVTANSIGLAVYRPPPRHAAFLMSVSLFASWIVGCLCVTALTFKAVDTVRHRPDL